LNVFGTKGDHGVRKEVTRCSEPGKKPCLWAREREPFGLLLPFLDTSTSMMRLSVPSFLPLFHHGPLTLDP
jgi:hypothetical protein